jgi:glycosyltransferase involved in cell wall biosynthesis
MEIKRNKIFPYIFIFVYSVYFLTNIISKIRPLIFYFESKLDYIKIENFLKLCIKINNLKKFKNSNNPKISIVSTIFNSQRYIMRFLSSFQYITFYNIEIILIDDYSKDNSIKTIKNFQEKDKRILLMKNKKNRGTFISRNIGALSSKGKYLIFPDPDDILEKNILRHCYKFAEKFNYEIIKFKLYNKYIFFKMNEIESRPLFQPELSTYIFYGKKELEIIDYVVSNKFIKKEAFIKAINSFKNVYLKMYLIMMEDSMMNYILYKIINSLFFIKKIGYYYIRNSQSITNNMYKISKIIIKAIFAYLKLVFENSKNNFFEKNMANLLLTNLNINYNIKDKISIFNKNSDFYIDIINQYINNKFITNDNKNILIKLNIYI